MNADERTALVLDAIQKQVARDGRVRIHTSVATKSLSVPEFEALVEQLTPDEYEALCRARGIEPDDSPQTDSASWVERLAPSLVTFDAEWWARERGADWLLEPLIPAGRQTALVAGPKVGKSLLMLEAAAALATGHAFLDRPAGEPMHVLYADMEMTQDDLWERLTDLGYGEGDDLRSWLHYYSLPNLPPLDTREGGDALVALADHHEVAVIVIDTTSRVISGEENSADTFQALYRHTGVRLKAAGRALVRLDHTGHQNGERARGSSAKAADVDLVWALSPTDDGVRLTRTHQRISWAPERVDLQRRHDPLRHELVSDGWPAGTKDTADALDRLGVPLDASRRKAQDALREAGEPRRTELVGKALKWRRQQLDGLGTTPGTTLGASVGTTAGTTDQKPRKDRPEPPPEPLGTTQPSAPAGGFLPQEEPPALTLVGPTLDDAL